MIPSRGLRFILGESILAVGLFGMQATDHPRDGDQRRPGDAGHGRRGALGRLRAGVRRPPDRLGDAGGGLVALFADRCPHCGHPSLAGCDAPEPSFPYERVVCLDCGATLRRRQDERGWRVVSLPPDDRGSWLVKYLPRLREARRDMRPDVVPTLDLPQEAEPRFDGRITLPGPRKPVREPGHRPGLAAAAILALIVCGTFLAVWGTWGHPDIQIVAILGVIYVTYSCLIIGWLWHLAWPQFLLMTAATGATLALAIQGFASVLNGTTSLALSLALILPATPLGLGLLLARLQGEGARPRGGDDGGPPSPVQETDATLRPRLGCGEGPPVPSPFAPGSPSGRLTDSPR